jgi:hypothetical protein
MYGGLCVALMLPEKRTQELVVHQSQKGLFDIVLTHSAHKSDAMSPLLEFLRKVKARLIG